MNMIAGNKKINVSVIIPTYNRADTVPNAIDSVLAQTYKDFEIIVVDDGSTDNTREYLSQRYGDKIRYIYQANSGPSAARNRGVRSSDSELVAFLDSDDYWLPRKLEVQMPLMSNPDVVLSYTNWKLYTSLDKDFFTVKGISFDQDPAIIEDPARIVSRFKGGGIMTSSMICRKSALLRVGGFDERMALYEDVRTRCRLSMEGKFAVAAEPLAVVVWADDIDHLTKPTHDVSREIAKVCVEIFMEFYARQAYGSPEVQKQLRRLIAYYLAKQSRYLALDRRYGMARRKAFESLAFRPKGRSTLWAIVGLFMPRMFVLLEKIGKTLY